ncbi:FAD-dependent oxidoreductase [Frigoribacterium sp. CFBP 13605]|uniref:FAD-dependent oxidoreductase n=1 Tax=Frigoribacterium sp. CFBP 13605 TaxID=2774034 RepID=UPI00190582C3|nr:FAD-dependent oxidoreductase [Frigoribacterium sp. CFBP 13605]MBD8140872.1 FAD-dependent oxidoreductase [Frigoribacterium sp. CFBP 13605]
MVETRIAKNAQAVLDSYRLHNSLDVFAIGLFDKSVTVLSQQSRALNLAWALTETKRISSDDDNRTRIAIIGAGFAGLSVAAGLVSKQASVDITLLEQRDSVLPLQHGNDTRWLHPHIYDWPREGSSAHTAGLPLLNWTAARASDVVVQVRSAWEELKPEARFANVRLFCNTASVKVDIVSEHGADTLRAEWVGQRRKAWTPAVPEGKRPRQGILEDFDIVILAIGFGVEADGATSYWRNETLAQPALRRRRRTYVVSGVGDGGWIDLFRIRISDFRQDRILAELFGQHKKLLVELQSVQDQARDGTTLIPEFRQVWAKYPRAAKQVVKSMDHRLRHDTDAILHVRESKGFDALFNRRVSFQNQLLAWVLHAAGGFSIWDGNIEQLAAEEHVGPDARVIRHGPDVVAGIRRVLGPSLRSRLKNVLGDTEEHRPVQDTATQWTAGYFGTTLRAANDDMKKYWRREYLPASTEIVAAALSGAIAGLLLGDHPEDERLRITLHRVLHVGPSLALQQCCDYAGVRIGDESKTAGRTFPIDTATIGYAYSEQRVIRTKSGTQAGAIQNDMQKADLTANARTMSGEVKSVLAIPIVTTSPAGKDSVIAVLYLDSDVPGFFTSDNRVRRISSVCAHALSAVDSELERTGAMSNFAYPGAAHFGAQPAVSHEYDTLEVVESLPVPRVPMTRLNLDQTAFLETEGQT